MPFALLLERFFTSLVGVSAHMCECVCVMCNGVNGLLHNFFFFSRFYEFFILFSCCKLLRRFRAEISHFAQYTFGMETH